MSRESGVMSKIKSKGFWEISIQPNTYVKDKPTKEQCKEIIEKCQVKLRGWYFQPIGSKLEEFFIDSNCVTGLIDFSTYTEAWKFYQSGQFVHYQAYWEDWEKNIPWRIGFRSDYHEDESLKVKGIIMTLYTLAEIFQLTSNFIEHVVYDDKVQVSIILHDTEGRSLAMSDPLRILYKDYKCMIDKIKFEKEYDVKDFSDNLYENIMSATIEIFQSFNWISKDIEKGLTKDLKDYLAKKLAM